MSSSPEAGDGHPQPESGTSSLPYYQAASFPGERLNRCANAQNLGDPVVQIQRRLLPNHGDEPSALVAKPIDRQIRRFVVEDQRVGLRKNVSCRLTPPLLHFFEERRAEARKQGSWVERHYRD